MKLNEKIFYCRRKAGMSQEALAEELGVSRQAVSKWETGDAVPEIGKLLALAKTFDVTTDWLLSEEAPEDNKTNVYNNYHQESVSQDRAESEAGSESGAAYDNTTSAERFEKAADEWMDAVPGVLGKLVRRFGWIAGIYIAVAGGGFAALGLIAKVMVNSMIKGFSDTANSMMSGFGGFGGSSVTFFDESGNALSAAESAELAEALGMGGSSMLGSGGSFMGSGMSSMTGMIENNPVSVLANIMFFGGFTLLVVGIVLAVTWRKKSLEQK